MTRQKILRICDSFMGQRFEVPQNSQAFDSKIQEIQRSIKESQALMSTSRAQLKDYLT